MKHLRDERGVAILMEIILAAIVLSVVGFAIYSSMHAKQVQTATATPTPKATVSPTPTPLVVDGLVKYASTAEPKLSFKYPSTWTRKDVGTINPDVKDGFEITSPSGTVVVWSAFVGSVGGGCPAERPNLYIRKVDPIATAPGLYLEEIGNSAAETSRLGIDGTVGGKAPVVGPTDCLAYTIFRSPTRMDGGSPVSMWLKTNSALVQADIPAVRQILGSLAF